MVWYMPMLIEETKSFVEIQKLLDKAVTRVNMFVDKDTELVKESSKKAEEEMAQESNSKRAGKELEQEKLVKAKHGNPRPEEGYERVLWGDLKTMFEHHLEDLIWTNLQGKKVLLLTLYDSCGIHFVRFEDMQRRDIPLHLQQSLHPPGDYEAFNEET
ncbi:hypothetical protein Tco_1313850 [Tanacetum coccineum]